MALIPFDASMKLIKGILKHSTNIKSLCKSCIWNYMGIYFTCLKNKIIQYNEIVLNKRWSWQKSRYMIYILSSLFMNNRSTRYVNYVPRSLISLSSPRKVCKCVNTNSFHFKYFFDWRTKSLSKPWCAILKVCCRSA